MTPDDGFLGIDALLRTQRAAHRQAPFPDWAIRRDRLRRLRDVLIDGEAAIESAIDADFGGRPRIETQIAEMFPSLAAIRAASRGGKRWMRPRRARVSTWFLPARASIVPRPLGVVGIIVPWNYPLYLAVAPLAGALAAGNRAMLKLSENTPAFSAVFRRLVGERFDPDEIAVVTGGPDVAAAFAALPFDHLLFTGSTAVGRKVMSAAAANLTPVTLELGGKSPAVIASGYPLEKAATRVMAGKLLNAGQTCIAPDYALVPRAEVGAFVEHARLRSRSMYPRGLAEADYCSIVDERHYARLVEYLDEAGAAGVREVALFDGPVRDAGAHRLGPVILIDPPASLAVMRDEIFGPILPVIPYDEPADALALVRSMPHPLALYWFDENTRRTAWALEQVQAGGVCINETLLHIAQDELPFGGVGASGMGHYHGQWGFDTLSKLTPVFRQARFNAMALFTPPYRPIAQRLLKWMKRW